MPKTITPFRFARHDFNRALRVLARSKKPEDIFEAITSAKLVALKAAVRRMTIAVLTFIIITASSSDFYIEIKTLLADIRIAKLYVVFVGSLSAAMSVVGLLNYFVINEYQRVVANKLLSFDNSSSLGLLFEPSDAWTPLMARQFRFLKSGRFHTLFEIFAVVVMLSPIVLVYAVTYISFASFSLEYLKGYGYIPYGDWIAGISLAFLSFPIAVIAYSFIPWKFEKNDRYIQWNFLHRLYKRDDWWPSNERNWLIRYLKSLAG